ncbi:PadR family transcriptional regulator [Gordoniibacillus kamchatkensis]|uniref:PadR family transcriptional regulator n=1 Tax=Gordoniibacillus kamchatkensis TaxID=1590651 RepID=A0ABR5APD1_9BACL|nr:PadR family transcriptional regulator [Paenibacillus sp. VKM B-2647]KIL42222.1 PadR family transcriptional regulator [Paenibacillus sp. VKM B-2647]
MTDERELLVLGLLMAQSQHGYQINEFIEKNLGQVSDMKKATAYSILKRLNQGGFVEVSVEQEGNRPQRQIYTITPSGERRFLELLRASIATADNVTPAGNIGFMFIDHLNGQEAVKLLEEKMQKVDHFLGMLSLVPQHGHGTGVDLSIKHRIALLQCEKDWLARTIQELRTRKT